MTTPTHSHKAWTDKGGHVISKEEIANGALYGRRMQIIT